MRPKGDGAPGRSAVAFQGFNLLNPNVTMNTGKIILLSSPGESGPSPPFLTLLPLKTFATHAHAGHNSITHCIDSKLSVLTVAPGRQYHPPTIQNTVHTLLQIHSLKVSCNPSSM